MSLTLPKVLRSPFIKKFSYIAAAIMFFGHATTAVIMTKGDSGISFGSFDQFAMFGIGCLFSIAILWCSRCSICLTSQGLETCTCGIRHFYQWDQLVDCEFEKYFGYLITDNDDRILLPVINIFDKEYAIKNIQLLREALKQQQIPG